jgi:hypothetical protein
MATVTLTVMAPATLADWNPGDPYKMLFPQLPDLSSNGVDVDASQNWLADDFQCIQNGPITDIHVWGSWKDDTIADPGHVVFNLAIYSDLPAPYPHGYSQPAMLLWSRYVDMGQFTVRTWATGLAESYWDPVTGLVSPDTACYQYNFAIPSSEAFVQTKDTVYWLALMAVPLEGYTQFGWKNSMVHFADDGVFWNSSFGDWVDLHYPIGHPLNPESVDLAFVITPEPATLSLLAMLALSLSKRGGLAVLKRKRKP